MINIEHLQFINVPATEVFEALTTDQGLAAVWTDDLRVATEPGKISEFRFGDEVPTQMQICESIPPRQLIWRCLDSDPEWIGTEIHFDLEEIAPGKTQLQLRHTGWQAVTSCYRFCNYNWAIFLLSLKQYCEEGQGMPYQTRKW